MSSKKPTGWEMSYSAGSLPSTPPAFLHTVWNNQLFSVLAAQLIMMVPQFYKRKNWCKQQNHSVTFRMKTGIPTPSWREIIWVQTLQKKHIFIPLKVFTRIYIHTLTFLLGYWQKQYSAILHVLSTCKFSISLSSKRSPVKPSEKLEITAFVNVQVTLGVLLLK